MGWGTNYVTYDLPCAPTYQQCLDYLAKGRNKRDRPLSSSGHIRIMCGALPGAYIALTLYTTTLVRVHADDTLELSLHGWRTLTTLRTLERLSGTVLGASSACPFDNKLRLYGFGGDATWGRPFRDGLRLRHGRLLDATPDTTTCPLPATKAHWTRIARWLGRHVHPRLALGEFDGWLQETPPAHRITAHQLAQRADLNETENMHGLICGVLGNARYVDPDVAYAHAMDALRASFLREAEQETVTTYYDGEQP